MNFFSPYLTWEKVMGLINLPLFKIFCIMKMIIILLLAINLGAFANGKAQTISLKMKNVKLETVLEAISEQTEMHFFYDKTILKNLRPIDLSIEKANVVQALGKALRGHNLTYKIVNETIVITERKQTDIEVTGTIRDSLGTISGVTITVEGSGNINTKSDAEGKYSIRVPENATLIYRFIGYETQRITVGSQKIIDVLLHAELSQLDEVIVVGYGVQRKANLTGAVDMITAKQLESRPIANLGAGLQGLIPNLNITLSNGRATTNPAFNVRGFTSINGGEPLLLVDNIPYSPDEVARLNPNDVESVSVLKDAAAAAIYGARGGFGVVLITTKNAKTSKLDLNFNTNVGYRTVGKLPEFITDPYQVMDIKTEAGKPLYNLYPEAVREYAKKRSEDPSLPAATLSENGVNWVYTGQTNWLDEAYNSSAPTYNASISLAKKADKLGYFFSGNYYRQDGLLKFGNDIYKRYNIRGKGDLEITKWLTFSNNTLLTSTDYDAPITLDGDFFWNVNRTNSLDIPINPDGSWTNAGALLMGTLQEGGRRHNKGNEFLTSFSANASLIKGVWDLKADATFRRGSFLQTSYDIPVGYKKGPELPIQYTIANSWARTENTNNNFNVYNLYTDFHKEIGDHYVQALLGYNQEQFGERNFWTRRDGLLSPSLPSVGTAVGLATNGEREKGWAVQGVFARLMYHYQEKYMVEFNGRYDGSSRFPKGNRWGFFPSVSAGWMLSNEKFFQPVKHALAMDMFKIRGSYGSLGNQLFSYRGSEPYYDFYPYIPIMNNNLVGYQLGGGRPQGIYAPGAVSDNFSWETIETVNLGVDLALLNNRLGVNFDKYTRYTKDMLIPGKALPAVFGTGVPVANNGDLKTKGWELRVSWQESKLIAGSDFWYSIALTLADSRSWITRFDNPTKLLGGNWDRYYEGREIGEIWGADIIGNFKDNDDVLNQPNQTAMGTDDQSYKFYGGDPIFADRNNDGKVDMGNKTVDNPGDMYILGNNAARLPYSADLSAGWKGFDIRVFLQGIGKRDWYPSGSNIYFWGVFAQPWTNPTVQNADYWTPENPNAYFPAVRAYSAEDNYQQLGIPNKRYLQNGAYMRIKNVTFGYTLPSALLKVAHLNKVRFFFSAENIFEVSHIKVKLDPESIGSGNRPQAAYPFQRTYTFGLTLNL